jgi:CubicO group peptidase (beta-lactamase class C family)
VQDPRLSNRALGWETADGENSGGHRMSDRAFGHTGFTGTSIWIDPSRDAFVLLLTNRVNPTRENRRIVGVRVALADAAMAVLGAPIFPVRTAARRAPPALPGAAARPTPNPSSTPRP